ARRAATAARPSSTPAAAEVGPAASPPGCLASPALLPAFGSAARGTVMRALGRLRGTVLDARPGPGGALRPGPAEDRGRTVGEIEVAACGGGRDRRGVVGRRCRRRAARVVVAGGRSGHDAAQRRVPGSPRRRPASASIAYF